MSAFSAVIFDCDGVLVDSEVIALEVEMGILAEIGLTYEREDYIRRFLGTTSAHYFAALDAEHRARFGAPLPEGLNERMSQAYYPAIEAALRVIPGARELVAALTVSKAVASSSSVHGLTLKLTKVGLWQAFAPHIYSGQLVARGKPAPDIFLHAADRLGVDPQTCVAIEDSVNGVLAARAAGMTVLGFTGGGHCGPGHAARLAEAGAANVVNSMKNISNLLIK
jgi:HAD superfamily hydrolase (TIGR01509 family)